jgi:hypothetical protein
MIRLFKKLGGLRSLMVPLALSAGAALAGCGDGGGGGGTQVDCSAIKGTMASVQLGTGETSWQMIGDNMPLPIIKGPQGGYHIWGAVRVSNMDLTSLNLHFSHTVNGNEVGKADFPFDLSDSGGVKAGLTAFVGSGTDTNIDLDAITNKPDTFVVTVTDGCGNSATDTKTIQMQKPN